MQRAAVHRSLAGILLPNEQRTQDSADRDKINKNHKTAFQHGFQHVLPLGAHDQTRPKRGGNGHCCASDRPSGRRLASRRCGSGGMSANRCRRPAPLTSVRPKRPNGRVGSRLTRADRGKKVSQRVTQGKRMKANLAAMSCSVKTRGSSKTNRTGAKIKAWIIPDSNRWPFPGAVEMRRENHTPRPITQPTTRNRPS
jgi:hypothetical protein